MNGKKSAGELIGSLAIKMLPAATFKNHVISTIMTIISCLLLIISFWCDGPEGH